MNLHYCYHCGSYFKPKEEHKCNPLIKRAFYQEIAQISQEECEMKDNDPVNHPSHYTSGKIEVIEALEDWKLDFRLANAVKYLARAGKKDPKKLKEDLLKATWYIQRYIDKECK